MEKDPKQFLIDNLRCVPDFPTKGINFRDITSWFINPECIDVMTDMLVSHYKDEGITKIVGLESRGFLMGSILSKELHAGFVLARKPGKLPTATIRETYQKEYGTDTLEIARDAITPHDVVLIHDDLLATGGTAIAAYNLVRKFHPRRILLSFLIEITDEGLHGRDAFPEGVPLNTLVTV
ncbi:MAG: adenine phosphoribosyltransferase [Bacteroidaceae bacterium]|nr:adenine phosphoribosyltransferase [Bacteroidaceae bacterium]